MTTYDDIVDAFAHYVASRDASSWDELWMCCWHRMDVLVKIRARKLKNPLPKDDIDAIILDSTILVITKLNKISVIDKNGMSALFWYANLAAFKTYNRHMARWSKIMLK